MSIPHIVPSGDVEAVDKLNQVIDKANEVDGKIDAVALAAEVSSRQEALAAEAEARELKADKTALAAETEARQAAILALPSPSVQHRPGDAPLEFCRSLADGEAVWIAPLPESLLRYDEAGRVVGLTGDDIVAPRHLYAVEPGRRYLATFVAQRRVNSPDPDNDAIRCAFAWYGQAKGRLSGGAAQTIAQDLLGLSTGSGRQTVRAVVSRSAGADVDIVAPAGARYCRPFIQTYGTTVQNDVEIISWADITDAVAFAPDVSALQDQVDGILSLDLGDRVVALESAVTAPNEIRLGTIGDLAAATIPVSADAVATLNGDDPADGFFRWYRPTTSGSTHPGKIQSADGRWWEPIFYRADQPTAEAGLDPFAYMTALQSKQQLFAQVGNAYAAWLTGLPTTLDGLLPGDWWNNGGLPSQVN